MMNITTLCQVALAKILLKGHACLAGYKAFELTVHSHDDGFVLAFSAKRDGMEGYDTFDLDIDYFATEAEAAAWLANTRVSTRFINTMIANAEQAEEASQELADDVVDAALEVGIATRIRHANGLSIVEWDYDLVQASPFFRTWSEEVTLGDQSTFHYPTLKRIAHYRSLLDAYLSTGVAL